VEGSTDKWLLYGLRDRWCPGAELIEGKYRGRFRRREIPNACTELRAKGVDLIILLRDANNEDWRDVAKSDHESCKPNDESLVVVGVCDRNVECWLVVDPGYAARRTGHPADAFNVDDPKNVFNRAMEITARDDQAEKLKSYVVDAPLQRWLTNRSFEHFYDQLWQKSKELQCTLENLRESGRD